MATPFGLMKIQKQMRVWLLLLSISCASEKTHY